MIRARGLLRRLAILLALFPAVPAGAAELAIIIDDLGYRVDRAALVAALPGPVAAAVLPDAPRAQRSAEVVFASGKEVLLHLPLQAVGSTPAGDMTLTLDTSEDSLSAIVDAALAKVPHVSGVNGHMGSLLTRHPGHMAWLMAAVKRHPGLYFVDSYTTEKSVALAAAAEAGIPALRRHVFLDNDVSETAVRAEFARALARARRDGYAIAIGHPYPVTLAVLQDVIPNLAASDVRLVPLASLVSRYGSVSAAGMASSQREHAGE